MSLYLDIGPDDELRIGLAAVSLEYKTGQRARLKIDAPRDIEVSLVKPLATRPAGSKTPQASSENVRMSATDRKDGGNSNGTHDHRAE